MTRETKKEFEEQIAKNIKTSNKYLFGYMSTNLAWGGGK